MNGSKQERWSKIDGFPDYEISDHGRVRSWKKGKWGRRTEPKYLSLTPNNKGYITCRLYNNGATNFEVHTLVGLHFVDGYFEGAEINHLDNNKVNNYYKNLEWTDRSGNNNHAFQNKYRTDYGENHHKSTLTNAQVEHIRELYGSGDYTYQEIADMYHTSKQCIGKIIRKERRTLEELG